MDNKIFEQLQEFENHLFTAYKCNYVRMLNRNTAGKLAEIYEQLYNQKSRILNGCGHCVLSDLKKMGEDYFNYKSIYQFVLEQQNIQPIEVSVSVEVSEPVEVSEESDEVSEPVEEPQSVEESEPIENVQVEIEPEPIVVTNSKSGRRTRSNNNKATNKDKK